MGLQRIKADEPADLIVDALGEQGAVIVEGLLSDDVLSRFNAELDPLLDAAAWGDGRRFINDVIGWFFGAQTRHVTGVAGRSRVFATEILTHAVYRAVGDAI